MKTNIKIPANSIGIRILSVFMSFLIVVLSAQQAFVGWEVGTKVKAASNVYGPDIYSNTDFTSINALKSNNSPSNDGYQYTGNIKPSKVAIFDYVSDDESKTGNSYNNYTHDIPSGGYDDAFTGFNKAISNTTSNNDASNNITIKFQIKGTAAFANYTDVRVLFKNANSSSASETGWYSMKADFEGSVLTGNDKKIQFTYTGNYNAIISALGGGGNTIQRIEFLVNRNNVKSSGNLGRTFYPKIASGVSNINSSNKKAYIWCDESKFSTDGNVDIWDTGISVVSGAENTYSCQFIAPLYFGCFYHGFDPAIIRLLINQITIISIGMPTWA